jgi:hypothetical protein
MERTIALAGLLAISGAACFRWAPDRYPPTSGLRWMGEARAGASRDGTVLGGPAIRFRFGAEVRERPEGEGDDAAPASDAWLDGLVGSWGGLELSLAALTGVVAGDRTGTLALAGIRPWLSRRQARWFLRSEQISVLGVLIPEVGLAYGMGAGARFQLGWDLPLGGETFQIVPGVNWIAPGAAQRLFATLAFRVPM